MNWLQPTLWRSSKLPMCADGAAPVSRRARNGAWCTTRQPHQIRDLQRRRRRSGRVHGRMILESFPYRVIEGLAIAAVATGSHEAIFYVRHEYPQALARVRAALAECERRGWLRRPPAGNRLCPTPHDQGSAGAFVCGEKRTDRVHRRTSRHAAVASAVSGSGGFVGQPTLINNVETLALVPWIIRHGAQAFAAIGTKKSRGTKVFALAGRVRRAGLIEVPMGTTIRQIVEDIGGGGAGAGSSKQFRSAALGGCLPARLADTPSITNRCETSAPSWDRVDWSCWMIPPAWWTWPAIPAVHQNQSCGNAPSAASARSGCWKSSICCAPAGRTGGT